MKISGKNNVDNQHNSSFRPRSAKLQYEGKDIANSPNPAEYIGRSQVQFCGKEKYGRPVKLTETPLLSEEEAKKYLKEYNFTDGDIEKLDFGDKDVLKGVSYFKAFVDTGLVDNETVKKEIVEYFQDKSFEEKEEWIKNDMGSDIAKYANKKTLNTIKEYIEIEDDDDFVDFISFLSEAKESEKFLEKLPIIKSIKGNIEAGDLKDYRYVSEGYYDAITPERAEIVYNINEHLPEGGKLTAAACLDLVKQEKDLTPEIIDNYCQNIDYLSQYDSIDKNSLKYSYADDTIVSMKEKTDKVCQMLKDYPMDLKTDFENPLAFNTFYEISQRKDLPEVQSYINSLSNDAKIQGILRLPPENSDFPKDKMAEICNLIYDKNFGPVKYDLLFKFIESDKENGYENLDGIIKLIGMYKGTERLDTSYPERTLHVENKDYGGAADAIKLKEDIYKKNLCFSEKDFSNVLKNKDIDFVEYNKVLTYIRDNDINYYDYPSEIYTSKNGVKKLELRHYMKSNGYWTDKKQLEVLDSIAENIETDEEDKFVKDVILYEDLNGRNYHIEDVDRMFQLYKKYPEEMKTIFSIRYSDGGLVYSNPEYICNLAEAMNIDKSYTNIIMNLKNCSRDVKRFYSGSDINKLVKAAQIDKNYVNELLSQKIVYDVSGNWTSYTDKKMLEQLNRGEIPEYENDDRHVNFKYGANDIKDIVEISVIDKDLTQYLTDNYGHEEVISEDLKPIIEAAQTDRDFVMELINTKEKISKDKEKPRFSVRNIKNIIEAAPENKQFVIDVINETTFDNYYEIERPKYNVDQVINLCKAAQIDEDKTKELMNLKLSYYNHVYNRFSPNQILRLMEKYNIDKDIFDRLVRQKTTNYLKQKIPMYNSDDIIKVMSVVEKNKNLVKSLLDINDKCNADFYSPDEISSIAEAYEKDSKYTEYLLSLKSVHKDGKEYPLVRGSSILNIVNSHLKDPEFTDKLVNKIELNYDGNPVMAYCGSEIEQIIEAKNIDKEYTEELLTHRVKFKNGMGKRFDGDDILAIVQFSQKNKDLIDYIVNQKIIQDDGTEEYAYSSSKIDFFISHAKELDDDFLKYLSDMRIKDKNGQLVPLFQISEMLSIAKNTTLKDFKNLKNCIGDNIYKYKVNDIILGINFVDIFGKQGINEVPIKDKKELLRKMVSANIDLFNGSDAFKQDFPLIPANKDEYCEILPSLVRSLGIETNPLSNKQIESFNKDIKRLSDTLLKLSDNEFNNLEIKQEYGKDEFIKDILDKTNELDEKELQKVYDYYGFELHKNNQNKQTGYSIVGYPVNLNNGAKLSDITDEKTKKVIEEIRANVIKFSEDNKIQSNNKQIEKELNDIVEVLPEIRTMIGRTQHMTHDFDVFKHSLKVMQKVSQDEKFSKLDDSDKKIMLLATLLHDITKAEGYLDETHAKESSYDAYFIMKKFKLSKEDEIKLYTLIKHHEWLAHVNMAKTKFEREKRQKSAAFDLQQNNLFELALMFTHADLKSVKNSDLFHDKTDGDSRIDFNYERRSFGEAAEFHAEKIREYIHELKKTQPLLPVTKLPSTDDIEKVITKVKEDGSTNIKGVYKDKDGLIVIKFNEVEDKGWELMGLPKGSSTKGVIAKCVENDDDGNEKKYEVETGNIKFFVHGLDYSNQLAKFDAFALPDSDALLSVSYAERPETKYRFFRPQGVILDVPSEYVYGGGESDGGSGCEKNIQNFKDGYIFGGEREKDRKYVSDLIKEATGMDDDEYIDFIQKNKNKSMIEIEPKEIQKKLIKKFATINSNTRQGDREYNEMYISNPKSVMGVFAYEMYDSEKRDNPLEFLENVDSRTNFLKEYAKARKIPFFVFGQ